MAWQTREFRFYNFVLLSIEGPVMNRIIAITAAAFVIAALASASPVMAQSAYCGGGGCGGWGGCGANYPFGLYGWRINEVPYFSLFPPVYYSQPVPRSYGWSPFAYPPGTMTPEVTDDTPQDMINPYVPQNGDSKTTKPSSIRTTAYRTPVAQVLTNPFIKSSGIAATASTQIAAK
jgi:hypothetical protein